MHQCEDGGGDYNEINPTTRAACKIELYIHKLTQSQILTILLFLT